MTEGTRTVARAPSALASEFLHPQGEDAEIAIPPPAGAPVVAAQPGAAEAAEAEAGAVRAAGVGTDPVVVERDPLTRRLVVREDETGVERDLAEVREVVLRQFEPRADRSEEFELLVAGLLGALGDEARNPEDDAVLRRLVREVPVLEVGELLVARAGLRGVVADREARLDAVADCRGGRDAPLGGERPVLGERRLVVRRNFRVRDGREVLDRRFRLGLLDDELGDALDAIAVVQERRKVVVVSAQVEHHVDDHLEHFPGLAESLQELTLGSCHDGTSLECGLPLTLATLPGLRLTTRV